MSTATAAQPIAFELPELKDDELYIGSIITTNSRHHVVLLPGDNDPASHQEQLKWAASIGGDLPDRLESALLYKAAKSEFQQDWYWTNEAAEGPSYAWCQYFDDGYQGWNCTDFTLRARAVRRLPF